MPSYAMACDVKTPHLILLMLLLHIVASSCATESEILLKFKGSLSNANGLADWKGSRSPCKGNDGNWVGVLCNNGFVFGLQLENMGLNCVIDVASLAKLHNLRTLSFMNNSFEGSLPDFKKLDALKSVYLSINRFSGAIPNDAFDGMTALKKVHLAYNGFTGEIPKSLTKLSRLQELMLEGNKFQGAIPDFPLVKDLKLNFSNNALEGPIPPGLSKMDPSSFTGNKAVCGEPSKQPCNTSNKPSDKPAENPSDKPSDKPSSDKTSDKKSDNKMSPLTIAIATVVVGAAVAAIIAGLFILQRRKQSSPSVEGGAPPSNVQKKAASDEKIDNMEQGSPDNNAGSGGGGGSTTAAAGKKADAVGRLSFLRDDRERFDLQDLLKASAEILGSGCFGSSYKANLTSGAMVVVKRFRQMNNVGKEEFQEHMRRLGRLRHPNLLPLVAYYYRKEEKLLVTDYVEKGSLAVQLHGNKSRGHPSPDWPTRLKIVKGIAKGLTYLYNELPSLTTPHGHLKSSNVLLDQSFEPLLTDYGLVPVVNQEHAQDLMVAYKSPEYAEHGRITKKTDVWNFGILILEIMTGKFPANFLQQGKGDKGSDLSNWVNAIASQESTGGELFDVDMTKTKNCQGEMLKLLKIGLGCCESDVEKRWDLKEVVVKIEELTEKDLVDEVFHSSHSSRETIANHEEESVEISKSDE